MNWVDAWLSKLDPNQAPFMALVWFLIIISVAFFWTKVWPWYTTTYFPAKVEQAKAHEQSRLRVDQEQVALLTELRNAIVKLEVVAGQQLLLLQQHSMESRSQTDNVLDHVRTLIGQTLPTIEKGSR